MVRSFGAIASDDNPLYIYILKGFSKKYNKPIK